MEEYASRNLTCLCMSRKNSVGVPKNASVGPSAELSSARVPGGQDRDWYLL